MRLKRQLKLRTSAERDTSGILASKTRIYSRCSRPRIVSSTRIRAIKTHRNSWSIAIKRSCRSSKCWTLYQDRQLSLLRSNNDKLTICLIKKTTVSLRCTSRLLYRTTRMAIRVTRQISCARLGLNKRVTPLTSQSSI